MTAERSLERGGEHRSLIMWTWQDAQVEAPRLREEALRDIAAHGFAGVLAMLRGCRYPVSDALVVEAARHAAAAAHRLGLTFWFALDPRLDQAALAASSCGGATYLITGRDAGGALPCESVVGSDGRYCVRLNYGDPRSQHMLSQVAFTFEPSAIELVVVYRRMPNGLISHESVRDISAGARMFVQRAAGYVEIFGEADVPSGEAWHVLALPRCASNYPDLGSAAVTTALSDLCHAYDEAGVRLDGVFWDEIGFVTGFGDDRGRLPWGAVIHKAFRDRHGGELASMAPFLLLDDDAGRAVRARRDYFAAVQDVVVTAQDDCWTVARQLWGPDVESGIHQTWHQNADDLPHGSGDWWAGSRSLSGGFTDVGEAEHSGDEVLAMVAIAASLARHHVRPRAFCNLWGVDFDQLDLEWWANLLCTFGVRWLAHTYGPTEYVDHVTGWGPGYPDHVTWDAFATINERFDRVSSVTGATLPQPTTAVVYPVETLARVGDASANALAADTHRVIAELVRLGIAIDVISPSVFAGASVGDGKLLVTAPGRQLSYEALVYPHPQTLQPGELARITELRARGIPVTLVGRSPRETTEGARVAELTSDQLDHLDRNLREIPRLVDGPQGALLNLFERPDGCRTVVVAPAGPGGVVNGDVRVGRHVVQVTALRGIAAVRFDHEAELERFVYQGQVDVFAEGRQ